MSFGLLNHVVNPVVKASLRSPLHAVASGSLVVLEYVGRRSGERRSLPVMYAEVSEGLVVFVGRPDRKRWWRNFRGGAPVTVVIRGRRRRGAGEAVTGEEALEALAPYFERFPRAAPPPAAEAVAVRIRLEP